MSSSPRLLLDARELARVVARLGEEISSDHPGGVVLVGVLKGGSCFLADLMRRVTVPCEVDFLALSSYASGAARVQVLKDLDLDIVGRDLVLVEDVVDTGLSARFVLDLLARHGARRTRLCTLLDRPARRIIPLECDYRGAQAPEDFLVGYGLDLAERFRNLPDVVALDAPALDLAPDELAALLYTAPRG